jgi:3-oxoacyl-[acyl-carrier protein] reductase
VTGGVVVVTGGGRGIGRAIAERLLIDGWSVAIGDIDEDLLDSTGRHLGEGSLAVRLDVTDSESVERAIESTIGRFGRIDGLVNNAAALQGLKRRPFDEIPEDEWDRVLAVNLKGVWLMCRAVVPRMRGYGGGSIVNISSDTVLSGVPGLLHYVSSKGGVVAFTRSLASEVGDDKIRVNSIAPGFTPTPAALESGGDAVTRSVERRALKRSQTPEDLVGTVAWLLSGDSAFVTGQLITVNGGYIYH